MTQARASRPAAKAALKNIPHDPKVHGMYKRAALDLGMSVKDMAEAAAYMWLQARAPQVLIVDEEPQVAQTDADPNELMALFRPLEEVLAERKPAALAEVSLVPPDSPYYFAEVAPHDRQRKVTGVV